MKRFAPTAVAAIPILLLVCLASIATAATTNLPDTAVGKLASELVRRINMDTPEQVRKWVPTVMSSAISKADQASFVQRMVEATRDSGGVEVFDVRTDPRQPGLLEVAAKGRRAGQRALFVLAADPSQPGKLGMADLVPMGDPGLYAGWPKAAVSRAELQRLIRTALDRLVHTDDFSGCLTVEDRGEIVFNECRGLAERNFGVKVDQHTRFHIGSIDKMFTAVAIAQLVEDGKLTWDTTLAKALPAFPDRAAAQHITVWQLLHHTSGLDDFLVPEYFRNREQFVNQADYIDLIARQPRVGAPGKQWSYSNAGYVLLGRIIETASGQDYFDYIQQHVFKPAGMTDTGFDTIEDVTPQLSVGYFREGPFATEWKADWMRIPFKGGPAGGGYSTNTDLLRFAKALRGGKLVKPATLAQMFKDEVPAGPGFYAAGFGDRLSHGRHIRGHAGGIEGTDADLAIVWETGATVALTSNEGPGQYWLLAERIADLLAAKAPAY